MWYAMQGPGNPLWSVPVWSMCGHSLNAYNEFHGIPPIMCEGTELQNLSEESCRTIRASCMVLTNLGI